MFSSYRSRKPNAGRAYEPVDPFRASIARGAKNVVGGSKEEATPTIDDVPLQHAIPQPHHGYSPWGPSYFMPPSFPQGYPNHSSGYPAPSPPFIVPQANTPPSPAIRLPTSASSPSDDYHRHFRSRSRPRESRAHLDDTGPDRLQDQPWPTSDLTEYVEPFQWNSASSASKSAPTIAQDRPPSPPSGVGHHAQLHPVEEISRPSSVSTPFRSRARIRIPRLSDPNADSPDASPVRCPPPPPPHVLPHHLLAPQPTANIATVEIDKNGGEEKLRYEDGRSSALSIQEEPSSDDSSYTTLALVLGLVLDVIPRQVYLHLHLRLPALYWSRVTRIFQDADMSMSDIKQMALEVANSDQEKNKQLLMQGIFPQEDPAGGALLLTSLRNSWQHFIDSLMREWKTLNIISVLLLSAILTILQIPAAAANPITRFSALLSLVCALMSLLYGCIYIIRFGTMRKTYKAAEWANESRKARTSIFWNVWVLLALPASWLGWSMIFYLVCIMSFVWQTGTINEGDLTTLLERDALGPRIAITIVLSFGLFYLLMITITFSRYGDPMDRAWQERIRSWWDEKAAYVNTREPPATMYPQRHYTPFHAQSNIFRPMDIRDPKHPPYGSSPMMDRPHAPSPPLPSQQGSFPTDQQSWYAPGRPGYSTKARDFQPNPAEQYGTRDVAGPSAFAPAGAEEQAPLSSPDMWPSRVDLPPPHEFADEGDPVARSHAAAEDLAEERDPPVQTKSFISLDGDRDDAMVVISSEELARSEGFAKDNWELVIKNIYDAWNPTGHSVDLPTESPRVRTEDRLTAVVHSLETWNKALFWPSGTQLMLCEERKDGNESSPKVYTVHFVDQIIARAFVVDADPSFSAMVYGPVELPAAVHGDTGAKSRPAVIFKKPDPPEEHRPPNPDSSVYIESGGQATNS